MERINQCVWTSALAFGLTACGLQPYTTQCTSMLHSDFSSDNARVAFASSAFDDDLCAQPLPEETPADIAPKITTSQPAQNSLQQVALLAPAAIKPEAQTDSSPPAWVESTPATGAVPSPAHESEPRLLPEDEAPTAEKPVAVPDMEPVVEVPMPVIEATPLVPAAAPAAEAAAQFKPTVKTAPRGKPDPAAIVNPPPPKSSLSRLRSVAVLYMQAAKSAAVITTLAADSPVQLMRSMRNAEGDWWYVKAVGESGWILAPENP